VSSHTGRGVGGGVGLFTYIEELDAEFTTRVLLAGVDGPPAESRKPFFFRRKKNWRNGGV
jgi:hypothetical protein